MFPSILKRPAALAALVAYSVFPVLSATALADCVGLFPADPVKARRNFWEQSLFDLDASLARLQVRIQTGAPAAGIRAAFLEALREYKRAEFLWEYAFPASAARLNGPPEGDAGEHGGTGAPAKGFQVLEEALYPVPSGGREFLGVLVDDMRRTVEAAARARAFEPLGSTLVRRPPVWTDSSVLDAVRSGLFRLAFLGLSNFDTPLARSSLPEVRAALEGMSAFLSNAYPAPEGKTAEALAELQRRLQDAASAAEGDFDSFDRVGYLTRYLAPAYAALSDLQAATGAPPPADSPRLSAAEQGALPAGLYFQADGPPAATSHPERSAGRDGHGRPENPDHP